MRENIYDVGDAVRVSCSFKLVGTLFDPTETKVKFKNPETGEVATRTYQGAQPGDTDLKRDSAGLYHLDIDVTSGGRWWVRWEGSGPSQSATERSFFVRKTNF